MAGAPVLSATLGTLISVLDACLVDGFNLKSVDSIVVVGGVATANMSTGVGAFEADVVALIAGSSVAELNGEKRVLSVTATSITFDATGVTDQTVTTGITAKLPSAGWSKAFTGTNLAAYRSNDMSSTRMFLRVDDTGAQTARVAGYESMSDINTGTGIFQAQTANGFWPRANAANATARGWTVIADSKTFYIWLHTVTASIGVSGVLHGFGDFTSTKVGDAYASFLHSGTTDASGLTTLTSENLAYGTLASSSAQYCLTCPRAYTGVGTAIPMAKKAESYVTGDYVSGSTATVVFPNPADNSMLLSKMSFYDSTNTVLRGSMRGGYFIPHNCHASFNWRDKVDGQGVNVGRKLMAIKTYAPAGTTSGGVSFFDITGPWG